MTEQFRNRFQELTSQGVDAQLEFFLKRYIFVLGDSWKEVTTLSTTFKRYSEARGDNYDLNHTEAADFLQKNGKTRTAQERKEELKDIDLDNNGRIAFIEYLLLHYKVMILTEFFEKKGKPIPADIDLSKDGVGVQGVGDYILEALFTFGSDIDPEIEKAIEQMMKDTKERDDKIAELKAISENEGEKQVARMKAKHELMKMEREDTSGANAEIIRLMAGRRRVQKQARNAKEENEKALSKNKIAEEEEKKKQAEASKQRLRDMKNRFVSNAAKKDI